MVFQKHCEAKVFTAYILKQHRSKINTVMEYIFPNWKYRIIPLKNNPGHAVATF